MRSHFAHHRRSGGRRSRCSSLFLHNVDLRGVVGEIVRARPEWLALSLATMFVNLAIRAWRWQYLLEPLGATELRERVSRHRGRLCREQRAAGARRRGHSPVFSRAAPASTADERHRRVCDDHPRARCSTSSPCSCCSRRSCSCSDATCTCANPVASRLVKWAGVDCRGRSPSAPGRAVRAGRRSRRGCGRASRGSSRCCRRRWPGCSRRSPRSSRAGSARSASRAGCWSRSRWSFPLWLSIALGIWAVADRVPPRRCRSPDRS